MIPLWNPWNAWKQAYDFVEQSYSETINSQIQEESFAAWMGACQQWYLYFQENQNRIMTQWLETAKIPSIDDLSKVSSLVIQVEEKVELLEDKMEEDILVELRAIRQSLDELKTKS